MKLAEQISEYPEYKSLFNNGRPPLSPHDLGFDIYCLVKTGSNKGKLTVRRPSKKGPDPRIKPVNFYRQLIDDGEDLAAAVSRLNREGYPLEDWELDEAAVEVK